LASACSVDLSPENVLVSNRIPITDSVPHELTVETQSDVPVLIRIVGHRVDVKATVEALDISGATFSDAPNRRMGIETLLIDAPHPQVIKLRLVHNDHAGTNGQADIEVVELPVETRADHRRLDAVRREAAGCRSFPEVSRGRESADAFDAAARLHGRNRDRHHEGLARLNAAGTRYARLSDWNGTSERAQLASRQIDRAAMPEHAAFAIRLQGAALDQLANAADTEPAARRRHLELAQERLTEAYDRLLELGNAYEAGYALNYRGVSHDVAGEAAQGREDFRSALALFRSAGDRPAQALSLQSLATQSYTQGRLADAMREFDEALSLIARDDDPENYAHTLHNSAWPLRAVGQFDEAIDRFHQAGQILHARGDKNGEARAMQGLATTLMHSGEPQRAAQLLTAAIQLRGETGARREQAVALLTLGELERGFGQIEQAINHLEMAQSLVITPHDLAQAKLYLARAYLTDDRLPQARRELEQVLELELSPTHHYLGLALAELGNLESRSRRNEVSLEYFDKALKVLDESGSDLEHARTLVRRAESSFRLGDESSALADSTAALSELESIGLRSLQAESRAAFRASYRDAIELQIAILVTQAAKFGQSQDPRAQRILRSAIALSDRSRARMLQETEPVHASPELDELRSRRDQLYELLAGKRQLRDRLQGAATPDVDRVAELTRKIEQLRAEASILERQVASTAGVAHGWTQSIRASIPVELVPENVVVAEYFVGRAQSWLFEVRRNQVAVHVLGSGTDVENLARTLHVAWRTYSKTPANRLDALDGLVAVLFGPLSKLADDERLFVVPDGPLHLVPIAVLARDAMPQLGNGAIRVVTALSGVEPRASGERSAKTSIAMIADPIYTADDPRIHGATAHLTPIGSVLPTRTAQNLARMKRLPSTSIEANAIVSMASDGTDTLVLLGTDANRQKVTSAHLERFQIVHFATHALADSEDPSLAMLALSRFDGTGHPVDGALRSFDIAGLALNADLVVLSACDTALGREIAGEGPIGLAHAFLRSGARSVLATLWQVPDRSTAVLMEEFYRQMLINKQPAPAALELAQRYIRQQPRWSDPYYWAGFQLVSNVPLEAGNNNVERRREQ
jgi:CHAT domain-containing protein